MTGSTLQGSHNHESAVRRPHCHTVDVDAVEAEKVKLKMQTHVRYIRARPGQVLAAGIASAAGEVRVKLSRTDSMRRYLHATTEIPHFTGRTSSIRGGNVLVWGG